jgi:prepilin-type N-terminal cleavage/methylation domain-containing protein
MLARMRKRQEARISSESGFSLVELVVVVAVIGILIALAVPRLASIRRNGQDTQAKTSLNAAKTTIDDLDVTDYRLLADGAANELTSVVGDVTFVEGAPSTEAKTVSYETAGTTTENSQVVLAVKSRSGGCFFLRMNGADNEGGKTLYHKETGNDTCDVSAAPAASGYNGW